MKANFFTKSLQIFSTLQSSSGLCKVKIIYNYPPKGRCIVVDIYQDAKRRDIYPQVFTDPEGDSCFSIYQIRWIIKCRFINGH